MRHFPDAVWIPFLVWSDNFPALGVRSVQPPEVPEPVSTCASPHRGALRWAVLLVRAVNSVFSDAGEDFGSQTELYSL